jgi:HPt (histidine-containing phosphotransfer) domain-containing protein
MQINETEGPIIDWADVLESVQGDQKLLRMMVEAALEEIPTLIPAMHDATARQDAMALRLNAHTLKSSLSYFTQGAAYQKAFELEMLGQEKRLADAEGALAILEGDICPVVQAMQSYLEA